MDKMQNWTESGLGTKVIVRSNDDEPYKVGELVEFERIGDSEVPIVQVGDKKLMCMGIVVPYTEELAIMLDGMNNARQWMVMKDISLSIQVLRRRP